MKILVIIPTYNECDNIQIAIKKILEFNRFDILVVDDNSPDGTAETVKAFQGKYSNINIIERPGKLGLGTAYIEGYLNL